jgi:hypothetical protein
MPYKKRYNPMDFGGEKERDMLNLFRLQRDDAKLYFENCIKPRLDRSYKLYISDTSDRAKEIKTWQCVSEDTEILSIDGWKKMGELKKGNEVLSYDILTGAILPDFVNDVFSYDIDGEMISIKNSHIDQLVTTNHRVITKKCVKIKGENYNAIDNRKRSYNGVYQYIEADKLSRGASDYRFPVSGYYDGEFSIGEDWAELVGWMLTDGSMPKSERGGYIAQAKLATLTKIRSLLISMKVDFREWSRPKFSGGKRVLDEHRFYFPGNGDVMNFMRKIIPGRKPNNILWRLPLNEKRRLFEGLCYGDGSKRPNGKFYMITKPYKDFQEWLQVFLHLMGFRGTIANGYTNISHKDTVDIYGKRHIKNVKYKGKVWSISTSRTNYIAKHNGKIFITGNSNVFVPYTQAVVETLKPRILDARPDFSIQGRNQDDQLKSPKVQTLHDYTWEIAKADTTLEDVVGSSLIMGMGYIQVYWKKDERTNKFLSTKDFSSNKLKWVEKKKVFYDAPYMEWVDNYELWYDWHNTEESSKEYWFRRKLLTEEAIKRRYPLADKERMDIALGGNGGNLTDYASVRNEVKLNHSKISKGNNNLSSSYGLGGDKYNTTDLKMHEVFEWLRPLDDEFGVMVDDVPILKSKTGVIPNPYDFKESVFIGIPYLRIPGEYEGYGLPMILENPQIMLNMIRNQRLDAATLNIHKMWIINPLANINKEELVVRPFGIIYSQDPNGAREVVSSDIKPSAYKEDEILKGDMRYSSGVDDFSMGVGGGSSSATEVRHLRESTLERVRLFVNHLGDGLSKVMRYWTSMWRQFGPNEIIARVIGDNGKIEFPLIEQDDLDGSFDFKCTVIPSIAGQGEIKKKQDMDLFQLLSQVQKPGPVGPDGQSVPVPIVDIEKLVSKLLYDFDWDYEDLKPEEQPSQPNPAEMMGMMGEQPGVNPEPKLGGRQIPPEIAKQALALIGSPMPEQGFNAGNQMGEMSSPINLLKAGSLPPTVGGINKGKTTNPRGLNMASKKGVAKVNTNIPVSASYDMGTQIANRTNNLQR